MKKTNPRAYLKLMMNTRHSSIDKCSSTSRVSRGNTPLQIINGILQQLKTKLVEVNLFETLEQNFIQGYEIKSLLKKLDVPDTHSNVIIFVVAIGPLLDQIIVDFQIRHEAQTKMKLKENSQSKEWSLANEYNSRAEKLEDNHRKDDEDVAYLYVETMKWKKEIEASKSKVEEAKHAKTELRKASRHQFDA